jgi:hypothetical protein
VPDGPLDLEALVAHPGASCPLAVAGRSACQRIRAAAGKGASRARRMTAPRNALAHAPRPPRGAVAGVRAPRPASRRAAAAGPHNVGLRHDGRNVEPLAQG